MSTNFDFYFKDDSEKSREFREWFISLFAFEDECIDWLNQWRMDFGERPISQNQIPLHRATFIFDEQGIIGFRLAAPPRIEEVILLTMFVDTSKGCWVEDDPVSFKFDVDDGYGFVDELLWKDNSIVDNLERLYLAGRWKLAPWELGDWKWGDGYITQIGETRFEFPDRHIFTLKFMNKLTAGAFRYLTAGAFQFTFKATQV